MSTLLGIVAAPWFRYAALAGAVLALIAGGILRHRSTYEAGREAGKSEVLGEVRQRVGGGDVCGGHW
ncbi:MAG: hypothetical protein KIS73_23070 [Enhydrobacter sp.]|nr:hypothetical protein [Enhydrobacter sp.]